MQKSSVADPDPFVLELPDPDPLFRGTDPHPFFHQAKIVRKTLISIGVPYCFVTFYLWKMM
jgi:hypothetical protein